ncbi:MAG TPA: esterase, partial [Arthrobacter sp.]
MDWIADVRLTDGPVYWTAWVLGSAGAVLLIWPPRAGRPDAGRLLSPRRWFVRVAAALAAAAALVLLVHWILIYWA